MRAVNQQRYVESRKGANEKSQKAISAKEARFEQRFSEVHLGINRKRIDFCDRDIALLFPIWGLDSVNLESGRGFSVEKYPGSYVQIWISTYLYLGIPRPSGPREYFRKSQGLHIAAN